MHDDRTRRRMSINESTQSNYVVTWWLNNEMRSWLRTKPSINIGPNQNEYCSMGLSPEPEVEPDVDVTDDEDDDDSAMGDVKLCRSEDTKLRSIFNNTGAIKLQTSEDALNTVHA